jgi:hypothetical protein
LFGLFWRLSTDSGPFLQIKPACGGKVPPS